MGRSQSWTYDNMSLAFRPSRELLKYTQMIPNLVYLIKRLGREIETRTPPPTTGAPDSRVSIYQVKSYLKPNIFGHNIFLFN